MGPASGNRNVRQPMETYRGRLSAWPKVIHDIMQTLSFDIMRVLSYKTEGFHFHALFPGTSLTASSSKHRKHIHVDHCRRPTRLSQWPRLIMPSINGALAITATAVSSRCKPRSHAQKRALKADHIPPQALVNLHRSGRLLVSVFHLYLMIQNFLLLFFTAG